MLEIIALCSCACLACLWCTLAFEMARNKCGERWIFNKQYKWQCRNANCPYGKQITSTFPSYKFVCKTCRHLKPECVCAKLFYHGMAVGHSNKYQPASIPNSCLPNLASGEPKPIVITSSRHQTSQKNRALNKQSCSSPNKQIASKKHKRKRVKNKK